MAHINGEKVLFALAAAGADGDQRSVFFYLLTPPDARSWAGARRFLPAEVLAFMPDLSQERVQAALCALERANLVLYDSQASLAVVPLVLEMQPYKGHNAVLGAAKGLADFPDSPVLTPVLDHLAAAEELAAVEMREKAEATAAGKPRDNALRQAEQAAALAAELKARLARLRELRPPCQGDAKGVGTPSEGGPKGVRRGSEGGPDTLRRGSEGGCGDGEKCPEERAEFPENSPEGPPASPSEGGPKGVSRARAWGPSPPSPPPAPRPPQIPPASRGGPPVAVGQVLSLVRNPGEGG